MARPTAIKIAFGTHLALTPGPSPATGEGRCHSPALTTQPPSSPVQRRILGITAIVMLLGAVITWLWQPEAEGVLAFYWQNAQAFCWRMGAVLAAAWLAFEDVQRIPGWLLLISPVLLIVLVRGRGSSCSCSRCWSSAHSCGGS